MQVSGPTGSRPGPGEGIISMHAAQQVSVAMPHPDESSTGHQPYVDAAADGSERTYATFTHLVGMLSIISASVPLPGLIGTIVMWMIRRKDSPFLDDHGREAVNFQLSLLAYFIGGIVVATVFSAITLGIGAILVVPLSIVAPFALMALTAWGCIRSAMAAHRGEFVRYPMCIRFISEPTVQL